MQSDDENFEESLETQTPERKTDPEDRYSLRRTPARSQSEKLLEAKMDQQKLFEDLCKDSATTAPPNAAGFAFGGMSSSSYGTAEPTSIYKNYTSLQTRSGIKWWSCSATRRAIFLGLHPTFERLAQCIILTRALLLNSFGSILCAIVHRRWLRRNC
jgi:hypothetical protein